MFYVDIRYVYIYSYMLGFYADGTCVSISFYIYTNMYLHKLHIYRSHTHYTYDYYIHIIYIMLYTYYDVLCTYYTTIIHIAYIYKLHVHTQINLTISVEAIWKPMLHLGLRGFHQGTFVACRPMGKMSGKTWENGGKYREHVDREYIWNDGINYGKFWEDMGRREMCGCISDNQKPVEYWTQKMQDDSCIVFCVESNTGSI